MRPRIHPRGPTINLVERWFALLSERKNQARLAHSIIYSVDPETDRAFLRDVLDFPSVDAGDGWLIFGLPPAELAIHPSEKNDVHEEPWGLLTDVSLPGGGKLSVYEALHERPPSYAGAG